jgi:hypothetical protein
VTHIVGKFSTKAIMFFRPHLNRRFAQEVLAFQNGRNPNFGNFGTPNLGIIGQNDIWMWLSTENNMRGKVVASPKYRPW